MKVQSIIDAKIEIKNYTIIDDDEMPIEEVTEFLSELAIYSSPNTLRSYCNNLLLFYRFCKIKNISPLDEETFKNRNINNVLDEFVAWLKFPHYNEVGIYHNEKPIRSESSVKSILSTVLKFYDFLIDNDYVECLILYKHSLRNNFAINEYLPRPLVRGSSLPKRKMIKKDIITPNEFAKLIKACNNERDQLILSLMYIAGMKVSEVLNIRIFTDLNNLRESEIDVNYHSDNENGIIIMASTQRKVMITPTLVYMITHFIRETSCIRSTELLFVNLKGKHIGEAMKYSSVNDLFKRLYDKTDIDANPSSLRESFIQNLVNSGRSVESVKQYLGLKSYY